MGALEGASPNGRQRGLWNGTQGTLWRRERQRYDRMLAGLRAELRETVDLASLRRILDIGCGWGGLTKSLAEHLPPEARILGVDISERMLLGASRGIGEHQGLGFLCADAQEPLFAPASFDAAVSCLGMTFFERPRAALVRIARSLRRGGQLSFVCWREPELNPWFHLPWEILATLQGPRLPPWDGRPGPFGWADGKRIEHLLLGAGFERPRILGRCLPLQVATSTEDALRFYDRSMLGSIQSEALRGRVLAILRDRVEARVSSRGLVLPGAYWLVTTRMVARRRGESYSSGNVSLVIRAT